MSSPNDVDAARVDRLVRHFGYHIPAAHAENSGLPSSRCPVCGKDGRWRSGVGFEHEKICLAHSPASVWCPDDIDCARKMMASDAIGRCGDGI